MAVLLRFAATACCASTPTTIWRTTSSWPARSTAARPTAAAVVDPVAANALLDETLPPHDDIRRGTLANGLKYVILPNKVPEGRFEAHLEMHVGSVDELPDEQ